MYISDKSEISGGDSTHWSSDLKTQVQNIKALEVSMSQSDSGSFTTWSKLKKRSSENQLRRHPSGNNNTPGNDTSQYIITDNTLKSQSMPNLYKQKIKVPVTTNSSAKHTDVNSFSVSTYV